MPSIGWPEIIIVLVIVLIIFGPKRLPHLGKSIGQSIRGFKRGVSGEDDQEKEHIEERVEASPAQLSEPQESVPAQPVPQGAPVEQATEPVATTQAPQAPPQAAPLPSEPPASVPPAPDAGERSATQV